MLIKDCISYTEKNIKESEVLNLIESYPLTDYIRKNLDLYDDILYLLDKKELTYLYPYKQKDYRTPNLIEAFKQFDIKISGIENFVKLKDNKVYIKIKLEII